MAEKKTTKKSTTKVVKDAKKIQNVKEVNQEVKCNCNCAENKAILNRIYYCLLVIVVITALILVTLIVKGTNNNSTSSSSGNTTGTSEEETLGEYDVSMFDTLTTSEALEQIKDGKKHIVYIGRSTCGYCVQFLPNLQKAQEEYGYKTIYINLEEMTSDDQEKILTVDNDEKYIEENLGYTPMVLIFEDGKLKEGWVGYSEYDQFASFLEENGYSK